MDRSTKKEREKWKGFEGILFLYTGKCRERLGVGDSEKGREGIT